MSSNSNNNNNNNNNKMSDIVIVNALQLNPSTDVSYNKPTINNFGGKSIGIVYAPTGRQLNMSIPMMLTWGVNQVVDPKDGRVSYNMALQFPQEAYATDKSRKLLANLQAMEDKIRADAIKNSQLWFNKPTMTEGQIDVLFNPMIYWPVVKETGERKEGASPTFRIKVDNYQDKFNCEIYNLEQKKLFPSTEDPGLTPMDLITKACKVACIIKCGGVYFVNGKFGVTWRLQQAVVKPKVDLMGKCRITINPEDLAELESTPAQELGDDAEEGAPLVIEEEEEEEEEEDAAPIITKTEEPEKVVAESPPPPKKQTKPAEEKVVKKRVIRRQAVP